MKNVVRDNMNVFGHMFGGFDSNLSVHNTLQ